MSFYVRGAISVSIIGILVWPFGFSSAAVRSTKGMQTQCNGNVSPGTDAPTPSDPFPIMAAGWGPEAGQGLFYSRWVEDWTGMRAAGHASPLKAIPISSEASLTLSAEARSRYDTYDNRQLKTAQDDKQGLFRGILGADLRLNRNFRVYGEVGTGHVEGRRNFAPANFRNDASAQQLFMDVRGYVGSTLIGTMIGRQEFADGPKQLISLSDGPNLHRTWNGVRFYAHDQRYRVGGFDLRATKQERGIFDESIEDREMIQGLNASFIVSFHGQPNIYVDPFWIHSKNPAFRSGGQTGLDDRNTYGTRVWGRADDLRFDWTLAYQRGKFMHREVEAFGLFAVQSIALPYEGWKPSLMLHFDIASGGGAYGNTTLRGFNQLYASSGYLGEGQFLSLSNVLLMAPGLSLTPTPPVRIFMEYGYARRFQEDDAVYAGGMRAYEGTEAIEGREIGRVLRVNTTWTLMDHLTFFLNYEHFAAGKVLRLARLPSGSYGQVGASYRY